MSGTVSRADRITSIVLTVATVVALGFLIEGRMQSGKSNATGKVEYIEGWQSLAANADVPLGDSLGPVKVYVFTDFECPYCARMDSALVSLEQKYDGQVHRSMIQFPLKGHAHAVAAASAFECARQQGRAAQMHHELYSGQSSFGTTPWTHFAVKSSVEDTIAFKRCLESKPADEAISLGRKLAERFSVSATPTVIVNGWLYRSSTPVAIEAAISDAIRGKTPRPIFSRLKNFVTVGGGAN